MIHLTSELIEYHDDNLNEKSFQSSSQKLEVAADEVAKRNQPIRARLKPERSEPTPIKERLKPAVDTSRDGKKMVRPKKEREETVSERTQPMKPLKERVQLLRERVQPNVAVLRKEEEGSEDQSKMRQAEVGKHHSSPNLSIFFRLSACSLKKGSIDRRCNTKKFVDEPTFPGLPA